MTPGPPRLPGRVPTRDAQPTTSGALILPPAPLAVVGCGTMGRIIVGALLSGGYHVMVHDLDARALAAAAAAGATTVPDLDALNARAVAAILSLPGPEAVRQVVERLTGLTSPPQVIVDTSTSDPAATRLLATRAAAVEIGFLDAPILGRPATAGRWTVPVGGEQAVLDRVRPVLEAFAARVIHVGPPGSGHTVKLLNQMMFAIINAATAEVMALAPRVGIAPGVLYETIVSSGAATVSGLFREAGDRMTRGDFVPVFSIDLLCKDTDLAVGMARTAGGAPVLTTVVQLLNHLARARGFGDLDSAALVRVYEGLTEHGDGSSP
ncbi:MAG: NAD(P)-dependent oxidoreductase [Armatimonadota bacterium]|nr:NAD(P)-dependent oxidoreductase [Armatimonadota bacterium]MDR7518120.1 NAD(P)-dependent oxidoreductase [Armatimonadota bacterium]MDR7548711.1 NAD(P)-dependent oxidoreductase [Armatimonadota bacterium]